MSMIYIVIIVLTFLALLDFVRAAIGPTAADRIVASSAITTKGMAVILLLAYTSENMSFIDVALVLALCGFVGLLALLRSLLPENAADMIQSLEERPSTLVHYIEEGEVK